MRREIVHIDEEKCDGCGECVPACAEGAIQVIDGKARLVSDTLCDGLGACLGRCPRDAIRIEVREAPAFDEGAVAAHVARKATPPAHPAGCPSARTMNLSSSGDAKQETVSSTSELRHWPVQLHLVPPTAPFLRGADLLICATCVPVAMPDFQSGLLSGRTVVVACPKLDNQTGYLEKLTAMFVEANLRSVTVARMEVPCCGGLVHLATAAREAADSAVAVCETVVGLNGRVTSQREIAPEAA